MTVPTVSAPRITVPRTLARPAVRANAGFLSVWAGMAIGLGLVLYAPHWLNKRRELQRRQEADQARAPA